MCLNINCEVVIDVEVKEALDIALLSGEILLSSGSEIYRVEDTIKRICSAYGIKSECFVTPTGIFISGWAKSNPKESVSLVKRIKTRTINLHSIEMINTFSRNLQNANISYNEALHLLKGMETAPYFPFYKRLIAAGLASLSFTMLFKGTIIDGIIAGTISMLIYGLREKMNKVRLSPFFMDFICSFTAGLIAIWVSKLIIFLNADSIIVGSIMILVPGLAITNGIRDAMHGDILSSQARVSEALYTVAAIGAGVGIALSFMKYWM